MILSICYTDGMLGAITSSCNGQFVRESFAWDGLALIQRGDEQFVNEPHVGGGNPVASSKGTSYFNNALGTTVGAKKDGKYSAAALTAFGEDLTVDSPTPTQNSNFFTGKPYVEGLGHAFLMRNYRTSLAKWQTADPLGYPDGWNQLVYCNNAATSAVDLWGCAEWILEESYDSGRQATDWKEVSRTAPSDSRMLDLLLRYGEFGWLKPQRVSGTPEIIEGKTSGGDWHYLGKYAWWEKIRRLTYERVDAIQCVVTRKELEKDPSIFHALSDLGCLLPSKVPTPEGKVISVILDLKAVEDDSSEILSCIDEYGKDNVWTIEFGKVSYQKEFWRVWGQRWVWE